MNRDVKIEFLNFLRNREEYFRPVHDNWYRTRCPYCGDTQKNLREGHLYINIDLENNYKMGYNCFRCGAHGPITEETIELMGGDPDLKQKVSVLNKTSKDIGKQYKPEEDKLLYFDFKQPQIIRGKKTEYIENRLGRKFTIDELSDMKVITSLSDFISLNKINKFPFTYQQMNVLEDHYVGFLSNGNSHILFRDITDKESHPWIKYPIQKESLRNIVFYSIKNEIDIFTDKEITINLSEGVMDAIGIAYHFDMQKENIMNISVAGKKYNNIIYKLIGLGLVGSNITVNIFSDNDEMFGNKKNNYHTTLAYYKKALRKYTPLFKRINVYYNMKNKDYGVRKEEISLKKNML